MAEEKMTNEEFKAFVKGKSDEELLAANQGMEDKTLDELFNSMKESFDPAGAKGQKAVIQYNITLPSGIKSYQLKVENDACTLIKGGTEKARVTMTLKFADFMRLMAQQLNGMTAYMTGKLKVSGDLMFSQSLAKWFKG